MEYVLGKSNSVPDALSMLTTNNKIMPVEASLGMVLPDELVSWFQGLI